MLAGFRGLVGGAFAVLSAGCMLVWIVATPQLRGLGRAVVLDAQLVMILAAAVVSVVAVLVSWSRFGRGMVAAVGLVLTGQGVLATVMSMGGLVITGRPGPPAPVSVWPIMAAMLGLVAVVMGVWRSPERVLVGRRQLIGSWVATLLAIAAVGVPTMPLAVAGAAPAPAMTIAGPYVGQAMTGILVILLATAGLRARRAAAVGQAVATMALMASAVWLPTIVPGVEVDTRPKDVALLLAVLALVVWAFTAGSPGGEDDAVDDWSDRAHDLEHASRRTSVAAVGSGAASPRNATAVLEPVGDGGGPGHAGQRDDPSLSVRDRDQTEVVAAAHLDDNHTQVIAGDETRH